MGVSECLPHVICEEAHDPEHCADLLAKCYIIAQQPLLLLMQDFYSHVDDELFALAKKSDNNALQSLYFDAMREIRLRRGDFERLYTEQFSSNYHSCCRVIRGELEQTNNACSNPEIGLKLIEADELEEQIAMNNLQSKAERQFSPILTALQYRYSYLLANSDFSQEQLPLSPKIFCSTFQSACSVFDISLRVRLILYKLLDKHMMEHLQGVYDCVDKFLVEKDVLPGYVPELKATRGAQCGQDVVGGADLSSDEASFSQLCELLNLRRKKGGETESRGDVCDVIPYLSEDIFSVLSQLQPEDGLALSLGDALKEALQKQPDEFAGRVIGVEDRNTIDLVEIIFDFIFDDQELSDRMKSIVARLQIPMLKVAILDKAFFSDKHYPARLLLNEFTQSGFVGSDDRVEDKVESLVNRIVNEFNEDVAIFSAVLKDFRDFLHSEQQVFLSQQQSQVREAEMQERRACAIKCVSEEISRLMPELELPELLQTFIDDVWQKLLVNTYLEEGAESQAWRIHLQITEDLLWSLTPKVSPQERSYLSNMIPHLIQVLGDSLEDTTWDQLKVDALLDELSDCHIIALRGESSNAPEFVAPKTQTEEGVQCELHQKLLKELEEIEHEEVILDEQGVHSQIRNAAIECIGESVKALPELDELCMEEEIEDGVTEDYYDERVANMRLGDWIEFSDDGESLLKVKLIWRGESDGSLIFANWQNEVVRRCNSEELAGKLRCWDARILNTAPIMERALSSVMGMLSEKGRDVTAA